MRETRKQKPTPPGRHINNVGPCVEDYERTSPENEPAIEWGERIATGKMIARCGGTSGDVPGATPNDLT